VFNFIFICPPELYEVFKFEISISGKSLDFVSALISSSLLEHELITETKNIVAIKNKIRNLNIELFMKQI
jgi:hypothetical protein